LNRADPSASSCAPALSVIVAASDSTTAVARTLAALARQRGIVGLEVVVAAARDRFDEAPPLDGTFPEVRWVFAAAGTGVPRLRRLGLDRASAPVIVFTEDSCLFGRDWAAAWIASFGDSRVQAATGPVEPAMGNAPVDWAVFFCEYAPFLAPRGTGTGPASRLSGNNFAVRRCDRLGEVLARHEIHEVDVARALAGHDGGTAMVPGASAGHVRRYAPREAIGDRLRFGRAYGRQRAGSWPVWVCVSGLFAGPAILGVQAARLFAIVLRRRRHLGRFIEALPITLGLLSAWSVGEWLGWLGWLSVPGGRRPTAARRRRETAAPPPARRPARSWWRSTHCTAGPPAA
jgi:hypothetical protein